MLHKQAIAAIPRAGLLSSLLLLLACGKAPPPTPTTTSSLPPGPRPSPTTSSSAAQPPDLAWDGFLSERLSPGLLYLNDANARDSTSAFEAILATEPSLPGNGPERPAGIESYWTPTVNQTLELGNKILAEVEAIPGPGVSSYRYLLIAVIESGKRHILAQALCDDPPWWKSQLAQSKLCRSAGSCANPIPPAARRDCQLRFSYDIDSAKLSRTPAP